MADENKEKSEEPTTTRLEKEREKGNVGNSREIATLAIFVGAIIYILFIMQYAFGQIGDSLKEFFSLTNDIPSASGALYTYIVDKAVTVALYISPIIAMAFILSIVSYIGQSGLIFSFGAFERAGFSRLNPISGVKRIFSITQLIELLKGLIKIGGFGLVALGLFWAVDPDYKNLPLVPFVQQQDLLTLYILLIIIGAIITMIPVAVIDYIYQNWNHKRNLRMSPDEVRKERKDQDGDPEIKGKIRQIRMQRMKEMMAVAVQNSDVLITNPTHFSIGLSYDEKVNEAPVVTAKGVDEIALHMRQIAKEHDIPIVENPPLARTLYATVEVSEEVKPDQWQAVAEVIRYVYSLKGKA